MEKTGFLDLYSDVNVIFNVAIFFSSCSEICKVKWRFGISSQTINTHLEIFKRDFTKPSFKHSKIIFVSVAFLFSLSILIRLFVLQENVTLTTEKRVTKMTFNFINFVKRFRNPIADNPIFVCVGLKVIMFNFIFHKNCSKTFFS